jgi:hypothetical protein
MVLRRAMDGCPLERLRSGRVGKAAIEAQLTNEKPITQLNHLYSAVWCCPVLGRVARLHAEIARNVLDICPHELH